MAKDGGGWVAGVPGIHLQILKGKEDTGPDGTLRLEQNRAEEVRDSRWKDGQAPDLFAETF